MNKSLVIGAATMVIAGVTFVGSLYAASGSNKHVVFMEKNPQAIVNSLSGKVSPEALAAFQALATKHEETMNSLRNNSGTLNPTTIKNQLQGFRAEMDALFTKYPDLKAALGNGKRMHGMMMRHHGPKGTMEIHNILSTLPPSVQSEVKNIREDYRAKHEALHNEEKSKIDALLVNYPEVRATLDSNRSGMH